ncbi:RmlC-like cupin domain-containing protein [Rhexocercosporidium sp. MPI-PUGE-AT-0058]|nr:RmlC-like cupin domain-containing protein [Rhexocercosporidium sp. MPI-PUGE-AT-0058]
MPPLKPKNLLSLRSKLPLQTTAIHRSLTPRKTPQPQSTSGLLIFPNTSTSTTSTSPSPLPYSTPTPETQPHTPPEHVPSTPHLHRTTITTPFNNLLNDLTSHLTTNSPPHLPTLHTLLRSYTSRPSEWLQYAHANPRKQYTRNLVTEVPGVFNLLLLVWTPGMRSPVHDHAGSHCLMKVLGGGLREVRYEMPESSGEGLREIGRTDFGEGKVAYISDRLGLHEIVNPSDGEYAVSLHLYTPPNAATYGCHVYDPVTGESKHVMQCAYDSVRGVVGGE